MRLACMCSAHAERVCECVSVCVCVCMTKVSVSTLKADLKSLAWPLVKGKTGRSRRKSRRREQQSQSVKAFGPAERPKERESE